MNARHQARLDDLTCSSCREPVALDRMRLLARRDDMAFLELACDRCSSLTLGFVFHDDLDAVPAAIRAVGSPPISLDDVLDMRAHLAGWQGDLLSLIGPGRPPRSHPGG